MDLNNAEMDSQSHQNVHIEPYVHIYVSTEEKLESRIFHLQ
jgi:hypothetical protein